MDKSPETGAGGGICSGRGPVEGLPPLLDAVYNRKTITMERFEPDPAFFGTAALVDVLKEAFAALVPLYRLLIAAVERDIEQAGDAATA